RIRIPIRLRRTRILRTTMEARTGPATAARGITDERRARRPLRDRPPARARRDGRRRPRARPRARPRRGVEAPRREPRPRRGPPCALPARGEARRTALAPEHRARL